MSDGEIIPLDLNKLDILCNKFLGPNAPGFYTSRLRRVLSHYLMRRNSKSLRREFINLSLENDNEILSDFIERVFSSNKIYSDYLYKLMKMNKVQYFPFATDVAFKIAALISMYPSYISISEKDEKSLMSMNADVKMMNKELQNVKVEFPGIPSHSSEIKTLNENEINKDKKDKIIQIRKIEKNMDMLRNRVEAFIETINMGINSLDELFKFIECRYDNIDFSKDLPSILCDFTDICCWEDMNKNDIREKLSGALLHMSTYSKELLEIIYSNWKRDHVNFNFFRTKLNMLPTKIRDYQCRNGDELKARELFRKWEIGLKNKCRHDYNKVDAVLTGLHDTTRAEFCRYNFLKGFILWCNEQVNYALKPSRNELVEIEKGKNVSVKKLAIVRQKNNDNRLRDEIIEDEVVMTSELQENAILRLLDIRMLLRIMREHNLFVVHTFYPDGNEIKKRGLFAAVIEKRKVINQLLGEFSRYHIADIIQNINEKKGTKLKFPYDEVNKKLKDKGITVKRSDLVNGVNRFGRRTLVLHVGRLGRYSISDCLKHFKKKAEDEKCEYPLQEVSMAEKLATLALTVMPDRTMFFLFTAFIILYPGPDANNLEPFTPGIYKKSKDTWDFERYALELCKWVCNGEFKMVFEKAAKTGKHPEADIKSAISKNVVLGEFWKKLMMTEDESEWKKYIRNSSRSFKSALLKEIQHMIVEIIGRRGLHILQCEGAHQTICKKKYQIWIIPVWYLLFVEKLNRRDIIKRLKPDNRQMRVVDELIYKMSEGDLCEHSFNYPETTNFRLIWERSHG